MYFKDIYKHLKLVSSEVSWYSSSYNHENPSLFRKMGNKIERFSLHSRKYMLSLPLTYVISRGTGPFGKQNDKKIRLVWGQFWS